MHKRLLHRSRSDRNACKGPCPAAGLAARPPRHAPAQRLALGLHRPRPDTPARLLNLFGSAPNAETNKTKTASSTTTPTSMHLRTRALTTRGEHSEPKSKTHRVQMPLPKRLQANMRKGTKVHQQQQSGARRAYACRASVRMARCGVVVQVNRTDAREKKKKIKK